MAEVPHFPLSLNIDKNFTDEEYSEIQLAARQWNEFGQATIHQDLIRIEKPALIDVFHSGQPGNLNDCSTSTWRNYTYIIVREDNFEHWQSLGFSKSIPGATGRCFQGGWVRNQAILVYPALTHSSQFSSVLVHEMGHALGLDHSCLEGQGRLDYKGCKNLEATHPYRVAVMFPVLRMGSNERNSEIKEELQENDRTHIQCVVDNR